MHQLAPELELPDHVQAVEHDNHARAFTFGSTVNRPGFGSGTSIGYQWAFCALTTSPGVLAHYRRRRDRGDWHAAAQRNLFNRMLGILHHCLTTRQPYDETRAFPTLGPTATTVGRCPKPRPSQGAFG